MLSKTSFNLKSKIIGIASSFSLPIMVLSYVSVTNINSDINFSTLESYGNEYQKPLEAILKGVVDHQVAFLNRSAGADAESGLAQSHEATNKGFQQLLTVQQTRGTELQFTPEGLAARGRDKQNAASVKTAWDKLVSEISAFTGPGDVSPSLYQAYDRLVADIRTMITHAGDTSNLILDPDLDSYYLMDVTLLALPQTQDRLGKIAAFVNRLSKKPELDQQDRVALSVHAAQLEEADIARVLSSLATSFNEDANFYGRSPTLERVKPVQSEYQAANTALATWLREVSTGNRSLLWSEFLGIYQNARKLSFDLWTSAVDELNVLLDTRINHYKQQRLLSLGGSGIALFIACLISFLVLRSITNPVGHLVSVVRRLSEGDQSARARLDSADEIGQLARQFDNMVDEREAVSAKIQRENEQMNNSILGLLRAVDQLAQKDLTVSVPVAEDVTGPVGDALNLLTQETAKVLADVVSVADYVAQASRQVKMRSDTVVETATVERQQVEKTATDLNTASEAMLRVAKLAHACNSAAEKAIQTTDQAQKTVLSTVGGITTIRDTIRETEKRIKRLGERSQEISGAVSLINSIAERTHILALNASMHAASAGEAGRGFAVVADEVQRLAENAREATSKIAGLVSNIQVETADTVTTMNDAISQVVSGSQLAEQAGAQMNDTRASTETLVKLVEQIAKHAQVQAQNTKRLSDESGNIRVSTQKTASELQEQATYTEQLVALSGNLVEAVSVFTLPKVA